MKQKQNVTKLTLAFLTVFGGVLAGYSVHAEESSAKALPDSHFASKCKELADFTPDIELLQISAGVSDCATHKDPVRKLSIFLSGLIKVQFDARRVEDVTIGSATMFYQMLTFLKMTEVEKEQFKRDGDEFSEEVRVLTCAEMRRQGPPTYHPWWFVKLAQKSSKNEQGFKIKEIDAAAEWDGVLAKYCGAR